jgi:hypothetical protein
VQVCSLEIIVTGSAVSFGLWKLSPWSCLNIQGPRDLLEAGSYEHRAISSAASQSLRVLQ